MTIVNMVGGGGEEEIKTETLTGSYIIQGKKVSGSSGSSTSNGVIVDYAGNAVAVYSEKFLNIGFDYVKSGAVSQTNYYGTGFFATIANASLGNYIKSKCPSGKTLTGTIYGLIGCTSSYGGASANIVQRSGTTNYATLTITGDSSAVTYSGLPANFSASYYGSSDGYPTFVPIRATITFS